MIIDQNLLRLRLEQERNYREALELERKPDVVLPPELSPFLPLGVDMEAGNWGHDYLGLPAMEREWAGKLRRPVGVAIIDTAWKFTHPVLAPYALNEDGGDFSGEKHESGDGQGHGTHCGGCVAAVKAGVPLGIGPAKQGFVKVIPYAGLNSKGYGYREWLYKAIERAVNVYVEKYRKQGWAWVISNSWGGSLNDEKFNKLIESAAAEEGIFFTASAGNSGYKQGQSTIGFPGRLPQVLAVGALDQNGTPSSFSSAGPELDYTAPGRSIYSTYKDGLFATLSGTSMSNPILAGVLSWILARFPEIKTREHLWEFVKAHVTDLLAGGFDERTGWGTPKTGPYLDKTPAPAPGPDPTPTPTPDPQPMRTREVVVTAPEICFRNRQRGASKFKKDKFEQHAARVAVTAEMKFKVGEYGDELYLLQARLNAYSTWLDNKTFVHKDDEQGQGIPDPEKIVLTGDDASFDDIAYYMINRLEIWLGVQVKHLAFTVLDEQNVTLEIDRPATPA